jgi:hypothetical protein
VAFKAEELTSKIFPESSAGIWGACPQDTLGKGQPCGDTKRPPCPENTRVGAPCPQDTVPTGKPPKKAGGWDGDALIHLRSQLRERLEAGL